ncbi:MAG: hypothetical protein JO180_12295 [Gemmatirosa sp.]|nr:hypothetical protein [Gemmatirosa sp.]
MPVLRRSLATSLAAVAVLAAPLAARAQGHAIDPEGDFIPSYTVGPHSPDLDVLEAWFTLDGNGFHLRSRQAGPIDPTSGHLFVWGVNRGQGSQGFPAIAPGVLFDAVLAINPGAATNSVRNLLTATSTPLPAGAVSFHGNILQIDVPLALLPSSGFALDQFTANLWPRSGAGGQNVIADFAPDNSNITVSTTPEPATALLVAPVLVGMLAVRRRRSRAGRAPG